VIKTSFCQTHSALIPKNICVYPRSSAALKSGFAPTFFLLGIYSLWIAHYELLTVGCSSTVKKFRTPMLSPEPADSTSDALILVVDDLPANARLLSMILKLQGFQVSTAASGPEALQRIAENAPDVVLLDVMMPGMDGFETCQRIRANPATANLAVVMVTALQEVSDRVKALEVGADDFITKPVDEVEVVARVKSLVRAKRARDDMERAYAELRRSEDLRDNLTQMLVHDLRTPLTGLLVSLDVLQSEQAGPLNDFQGELVSISKRSGGNLLKLINDILDVAKLECGQMSLSFSEFSFSSVAEEALLEVVPLVNERQSPIDREWEGDGPLLTADAGLIQRILVNLLSNALKFSLQKGHIEVGCKNVFDDDGTVVMQRVWVKDHGRGIPPEHHDRIWDKFGQSENRHESNRVSTGLGLTFCKLAVEVHGGHIGLESTLGQGSTFYFTLPAPSIVTKS
jgi:signal transduction histidine kinase